MYEFSDDGADGSGIGLAFRAEAVEQEFEGILGVFMPDGCLGAVPEDVPHQSIAMMGQVRRGFPGTGLATSRHNMLLVHEVG